MAEKLTRQEASDRLGFNSVQSFTHFLWSKKIKLNTTQDGHKSLYDADKIEALRDKVTHRSRVTVSEDKKSIKIGGSPATV